MCCGDLNSSLNCNTHRTADANSKPRLERVVVAGTVSEFGRALAVTERRERTLGDSVRDERDRVG